jgi:hypothetical protein
MARTGHLLERPEHGPERRCPPLPITLELSVQVAAGNERRRKDDDHEDHVP